ncbi:hypothetical protein FRC09_000874 [Ceratobasidium sp. 395]|nr:hypothetical protein FRC09_000874 [Ceratobasidium sp. 395]
MSNNLTRPDAPAAPYYVAKYENRVVAIKRDESYEVFEQAHGDQQQVTRFFHLQATIRLIQKSIPHLRSANIQDIFLLTTLPEYGDALVQIGENIWPDLIERVKSVEVRLEEPDHVDLKGGMGSKDDTANSDTQDTQEQVEPAQTSDDIAFATTDSSDPISIKVLSASLTPLIFNDCNISTTTGDLASYIETKYGIPAALQTIEYRGKPLGGGATLDQSGITNGSTLGLGLNTRQTMIYFCPYRSTRPIKGIAFEIELNRSWELIALKLSTAFPPIDYIQTQTWHIDITEESMIHDHHSEQTRRYLLWDGILDQPSLTDSATPSPDNADRWSQLGTVYFTTAVLPNNSVAVLVDSAADYISSVVSESFNIPEGSVPEFLR